MLLETTGAADPFGVTAVLEQDAWLRKRFTLRSILTTVDTVAGEAALRRHPEALEQVTAADQLLLTKTDRATAAQRVALAEALARLNPRAGVLDAERADAGLLDRDFPRQCRITGTLAPAAPADLVLFDPSVPFVLDRVALRSKSRNTPFDGARMEGKVLGTWVGGRRVFGA